MTATDKWGITQVKTKKCNYTWTIQNFSYLSSKTGEELQSPDFTMKSGEETKWCLRLYAKGINEDFKDHLSLYLYRKSDAGGECHLSGQIALSVLSGNKEKLIEQRETYHYHKNISSWGFPAFAERDVIFDQNNGFLSNDCLALHCEITMVVDCLSISSSESRGAREKVAQKTSDFGGILLSEKFSDVKLRTSCGGELHAHKNILAAGSSIFAAMFEHGMSEARLNVVEIADIEYGVLKELLRFVYTRKVEGVESVASELLAAADKYEINGLKELCEETLYSNMSTRNVVDILVVSDRHNIVELKRQALNFIKVNVKDILELPEFKSIAEPTLFIEIIKILVDS